MQLLPPSKEAETWEEFVKSLEGLNVPKRDIHGWKKRQPRACSSRLRKIPGKDSTNLSLMYTVLCKTLFPGFEPMTSSSQKKNGHKATALPLRQVPLHIHGWKHMEISNMRTMI
jgi:hypothetical protein